MEKATSTFPRLEGAEAQERFLTSPEAVLQSIGLRVPAALATQLRRSSVPPPPSSAMSAIQPAPASAAPELEPVPAAVAPQVKPVPAAVAPRAEPAPATVAPESKPSRKRNKAQRRK